MTALHVLMISAISGFLAVAFGAFGSHALKQNLDTYSLGVWETANQYHFYVTFSLLATGLLLQQFPAVKMYNASAILFMLGGLIFSASLYALALSGIKVLGAITPIGGTLLLLAWLAIALGAYQSMK